MIDYDEFMKSYGETKMTDCLGVVGTCKECGNPVLEYLCNVSISKIRKESKTCDYWVCCSNILCKNHYGSGAFQQKPDWIKNY